MSSRARRVLFALHEPGYFRFYGPTIVELARRGWDVSLVYDKPERRGPDAAVPVNAGERVRSLGALPGQPSNAAARLRATIDSVRYLEPAFAGAGFLRRRAENELSPSLAFLARVKRVPRGIVTAAIGIARAVERLIPVNEEVLALVRRAAPDVIVVSPLVVLGGRGAHETEVVKAGRALGVPTVVGVASWDHLTSKGLIRVVPDAVMVWNDIQAEEAEQLHRIPARRIVITGAQSLDRWFERPSEAALQAFRRSLGIENQRRVLLWVGSSPNMAPGDSEVHVVRRWLAALRASRQPALRDAFAIIRPHPANTEPWQHVDLGDAGARIHPTAYPNGVLFTDTDVDTFRYSMLASSAVVGINTTAMIEAAIVRRPVLSVRDAAFTHSQEQTLHFGHLIRGCATVADTLDEHIAQLERLLTGEPDLREADRFVARFVRPLGMERSAMLAVCDAIEHLAAARTVSSVPSGAMSADGSDAVSGRA